MNRYIFITLTFIGSLVMISWGPTGHRAVAQIAENHLTPQAKLAVHKILNGETLVDVANYADELRNDPQFKYTGAWHYVNIRPGYSYPEFAMAIKSMKQDNVYKAVITFERELKDPDKSKLQRATALKFLVHFIGDLHQPMHVSNGDDKGGNAINVSFKGQAENLHGLWDGGLIDRQGLSYKQMAATYDTATPAQINKWQNDDLMMWLWQSYQISTILYKEAAENPNFDEEYYKSHLPALQLQIEKAGIRLAGVLNAILGPANGK